MALPNNPTPAELVKAVKDLEQGGGETLTEFLPLLNNTEYKAFAFIENEDTNASHTTRVDLVLPTTIRLYDFCSKYTGLSIGDKILVFVTTYNKIAKPYDKVSAVCGSTITAIDQYGNYSVTTTQLGISLSTQSLFAFKSEVPTTTSSVTQGSTSALTSGGAYTALSDKQDKTDSNLQTTSQTVVGAINEVNSIVKQANIAKSYASYSAFITALNSASATDYKVGQSFYIETLEVPDLWVISVESSSSTYTYTTDSAFITATAVSGGQQVGYYKIGQLETQKVDISSKQDVIDASHKLSADLVDDASTTNKFVTASDKSTWNGKQDALTFDTTPTQNSTNPVTSGGVYSAIKGLRVKFSRWMRWEWDNNTQSGSHTCSFTSIFDGTSGNLADNEFISSVTLHSHGNAYANNAIAFITGFTFTSSSLNVTYYRDNNDNNLKLRCMVIVCKIE